MLTILRIENAEGKGPFSWLPTFLMPRDMVEAINEVAQGKSFETWPLPERDGIQFERGVDQCGFRNKKQLRKWFDTDGILRAFEKYGFSINKYKVSKDSLKIGGCQVAFKKSEAKLVESIKPTEFIASV